MVSRHKWSLVLLTELEGQVVEELLLCMWEENISLLYNFFKYPDPTKSQAVGWQPSTARAIKYQGCGIREKLPDSQRDSAETAETAHKGTVSQPSIDLPSISTYRSSTGAALVKILTRGQGQHVFCSNITSENHNIIVFSEKLDWQISALFTAWMAILALNC